MYVTEGEGAQKSEIFADVIDGSLLSKHCGGHVQHVMHYQLGLARLRPHRKPADLPTDRDRLLRPPSHRRSTGERATVTVATLLSKAPTYWAKWKKEGERLIMAAAV